MRLNAVSVCLALIPLACVAPGSKSKLESANAPDQMPGAVADDGHCSDAASFNQPLPCPVSMGAPQTVFLPDLLSNRDQFNEPFYSQFNLAHDTKPLQLTDTIAKDYFFPTMYGDVTQAVAIFYCSYQAAAALIPDPSLKPVSMGQGRSLVVLTSFRYNKVFGIPPYNEIAVSIPVVRKSLLTPPVLPLVFQKATGLAFYVASMPVTTLENQIRGHKIWGLPKVLQEIDLTTEGSDYWTRAKDETGATYLQFRVPVGSKEKMAESSTRLVSRLEADGTLVSALSEGQGSFSSQKFPKTIVLKNTKPDAPFLILGDAPAAQMLRDLQIEPQPYEVRFAADVSSVFNLPAPYKP